MFVALATFKRSSNSRKGIAQRLRYLFLPIGSGQAVGGTFLEGNLASKCPVGFVLSQGDKYRNNITISCATPFNANGVCSEAFHLAMTGFSWSKSEDALHPMNSKIFLFLFLFLTVGVAFAEDAMKFVSPDKSATLVVDKSGKRDIIELQSGKRVHRLFYENLDSIFKPKIAEAFGASLDKVGKIVLPTFISARWISADEVEIKGESVVTINDSDFDEFTFTASVSKSGHVNHLTVTPKK
jgi:hypothetical protein